MKIQFIHIGQSAYNGVETFGRNFNDVLLPEILKSHELVEYPLLLPRDITYGITRFVTERYAVKNSARLIGHMHRNYTDVFQSAISSVKNAYWERGHVIVHSKGIQDFVAENLCPNTYFIPMSINVINLPNSASGRNGKWVYYGNNTGPHKNEIIQYLKSFMDFDVVSGGSLNGGGIPHSMSRIQSLELVNTYSYGIGVGQAALEMLAMGMPCIIAGRNYGGPILNNDQLNSHREYNCNGTISTSLGNISLDKQAIESEGYVPQKETLHISQMLPLINQLIGGI